MNDIISIIDELTSKAEPTKVIKFDMRSGRGSRNSLYSLNLQFLSALELSRNIRVLAKAS